ncbi:hypothetical protein CEXT_524041 [Caerostris extrusa]|uniref:Uncharacterized protein n=1 Tax=Caerostris extrusa TaxID=172846 RepID=A0AAV4MZ89_CAEEX|nr:hypothetical protein CEXT_524041 [Caerostris extrusa]
MVYIFIYSNAGLFLWGRSFSPRIWNPLPVGGKEYLNALERFENVYCGLKTANTFGGKTFVKILFAYGENFQQKLFQHRKGLHIYVKKALKPPLGEGVGIGFSLWGKSNEAIVCGCFWEGGFLHYRAAAVVFALDTVSVEDGAIKQDVGVSILK